jgi:hypothetical protein
MPEPGALYAFKTPFPKAVYACAKHGIAQSMCAKVKAGPMVKAGSMPPAHSLFADSRPGAMEAGFQCKQYPLNKQEAQ